jgi:hypothetical protein
MGFRGLNRGRQHDGYNCSGGNFLRKQGSNRHQRDSEQSDAPHCFGLLNQRHKAGGGRTMTIGAASTIHLRSFSFPLSQPHYRTGRTGSNGGNSALKIEPKFRSLVADYKTKNVVRDARKLKKLPAVWAGSECCILQQFWSANYGR